MSNFLDSAVGSSHSPRTMKLRAIVAWGFPGVGKTQLALQYLETRLSPQTSVFWVTASSMETVYESYEDIAEEISRHDASFAIQQVREKAVEAVTRWLANSNRPWVLVVDSVGEKVDTHFRSIIPMTAGNNGSIIVTSNSLRFRKRSGIQVCKHLSWRLWR